MQGREGSAPRSPGDCLIRHAVLTECRSAGLLRKQIQKCNSEGICSHDRIVRSRLPTDWSAVTAASGRPSIANWAAGGSPVPWLLPPAPGLLCGHTPSCTGLAFQDSSSSGVTLPSPVQSQGRDQEGRLTEMCDCKGKDTERSCHSQAQPVLGRVTSRAGLRQLEPRRLGVQSPLLLNTCQRIRGDAPPGYRCPATSIGPCPPSLDTSWVDPRGRKGPWRLVTSRGGGTYQRLSGVYFSNSNFGNLKNYN